jgi:uncharacterized delta-60 repeat protein
MDARPLRRDRACAAAVPASSATGRAIVATLAFLAAFALLLWFTAAARATAGVAAWTDTWNTPQPGQVLTAKTQAKPGGGMYVAASLRRASGDIDIAVLRITSAGAVDWAKYYDGAADGVDWMKGIAVDARGNVVVCGSTYTEDGAEDWVVLKYAPDGSRRWVRRLAGAFGGADVPQAIDTDARGNVVVAGSVTRRATGADWCVAKLSPRGFRLWRTRMTREVAGYDEALALAVDPANGQIYVAGRMFGSKTGDDVITMRYGADGHRVWRARWDGNDSGPDRGVAIDLSEGGVAVAGVTGNLAGGDDGVVLKYAKNGAFRWAKVVDGGQGATGVDRFTAVGIDERGAVVAGGAVSATAGQGTDVAVVRYLASGAPGGSWRLPGAADDEAALDLDVTPEGESFAVGTAAGAGSVDAVVAGLTRTLTALWPPLVSDLGGADDLAQSVSVSDAAVYVAGVSGADLLFLKIPR